MTRRPQVFVVDSDRAIRLYLRRNLVAEGYKVRECSSTANLIGSFTDHAPDAVVLGLDNLANSGTQIIRSIRDFSHIPILALSASTDNDSLVAAIESGADDYVRKPFAIQELLARLHSVLRRAVRQRRVVPTFVSGDLEVDLVRMRVKTGQGEVHLSVKLYEVLKLLVERADTVVRYEEIVTAVWGTWRPNRVSYVRIAVRQIRCLIENDPGKPSLIVNERGVGYRLRLLADRRQHSTGSQMNDTV